MKTEKVKLSKKSTARLRQRYYKRFGYHKPMPGYSGGTGAKEKHFVPPNSVVTLLPAMPLLSSQERLVSKKKERAIQEVTVTKISNRAPTKDFPLISKSRWTVNYC